MTKEEVIEYYHGLIEDDGGDADFESDLFDQALEELYGEREWEFLKKKDSTQKWSVGDTSDTAKTLPTNFVSALAVYMSGESTPFFPVPFEKQEEYKDYSGKFFIDFSLRKFYMTGETTQEYTINLFYIFEPEILDNDEIPPFPTKYHKLIAFYMAAIYFNIDFDDTTIIGRLGEKNYAIGRRIRRNMVQWDARIKTQSYNGTKI